jgi:hypothetical protein
VCKQTQREIDALGMTMVMVVMVEPYLRPIHSCNAHRELETESRRRRRRRRRKRGERERYDQARERISERGRNPLEKPNLSERRKLSYLVWGWGFVVLEVAKR